MARRVYLHIGTMKSATTYLQKILDANRRRLREQGILWQPSGVNHRAVRTFIGIPLHGEEQRDTLGRFRRAIRDHEGDALISTEFLGPFPTRRAARFVESLGVSDVRIIVTARDLTKVVPSHWQETTQNQGTTRFTDYVRQVCAGPEGAPSSFRFWRQHDLPRIYRDWSPVVTPGHFTLVTVPRDSSDPDLVWRRFASVIGVSPDGIEPPARSNPSIGGVSAELMRQVNGLVQDLDLETYGGGLKMVLAKQYLVTRAAQEPRPTLTPESYARIREIAVDMVKEIEQIDDLTVVGDLDDLVPAEEPPKGDPFDPADAAPEELLEAAVTGLAGLGTRFGELVLENKRLTKQNQALRRRLKGKPEPTPARGSRLGRARRVALRARRSVAARVRR